MQCDAVRLLVAIALHPVSPGKRNRVRRRGAASRCDMRRRASRLAGEIVAAAERRGIDHLHEYGGAPAVTGIGAAETRKAAGQRLDQERQRVALVTGIESAQRQERALGIVEQHRRIVGRVALRILIHGCGSF